MSRSYSATIIIPTFRSRELVAATLRSALDQSYPAAIVVCDNCSDDGTTTVARQVAEEHRNGDRVQVIEHAGHVGRIANWNRCLDYFESGTSDYLKLLFAGDRLAPDAVAALVHAAASAEAVLATSACEIVDGELRQRPIIDQLTEDTLLSGPEALLLSARRGNWFGAPSALLVARAALRGLRFSEEFDWAADWKFCLELSQRGRTVWLSRPLATINLAGRRHFQVLARKFSSRLEEAWMRSYTLRRLGERSPGDANLESIRQECEQSIKQSLISGRDLLGVTAAKINHRLAGVR